MESTSIYCTQISLEECAVAVERSLLARTPNKYKRNGGILIEYENDRGRKSKLNDPNIQRDAINHIRKNSDYQHE